MTGEQLVQATVCLGNAHQHLHSNGLCLAVLASGLVAPVPLAQPQ